MFASHDGMFSSTAGQETSFTKRTRNSRVVCLTFIAFLATACASFPEYRMQKVDRIPASTERKLDKPSVYIPLKYIMTNISGHNIEPTEPLPELRKIVEEIVDETALFRSTTYELFQAKNVDNVLQIEIMNYGDIGKGVAAGLITGLTLFVIPTAETDNFKLTANLFDGDGKLLKTYSYDDSVTTWVGIWLIPVAGNTIEEAYLSILENMIRTLFLNIRKDGLLTKNAKKQERR